MKEARSGSLYERLRMAGVLDEFFSAVYDGGLPLNREGVRWLKAKGVECSQSAMYELVRQHGLGWRYSKSQEVAAAMNLPEDMDAAAAQVLRKKVQMLTFEADTLKEVAALARISQDTEKLAQAERKVKVAEENLALKVHAAQWKAAEEINEVLTEAARLESLQRVRADMAEAGAVEATIIEAIRRKVYGGAAVLLGPDNKGGAA